ncbi:SGT1 protein-domain-containing protein [Exophiala viscosa]|uniref:SGT1 protein-domain-containing protein n=1 Tax=Exophiala viscosa TaxID=2486360 RepID=A0AAN6IB38_9EURO|nr:SGT1 protein-domain-containing protein [Exophiala viscosa]KAI1620732.1 SGT1 protein-domain-containing protein [Exophiala viscosa]
MPPTDEDIAWFQSTFHPIPKPALPDDCIEYSIYLISSSLDASHDSELRLRLRDVQKYATDLHKQYLKDYIWQRQGFSLELNKEDGLSFLQGRTEYGDSVEDEWVIVWLLRELTRKFNDIWVKVTDSDGEFLLIEASGTLPAWLEPDVAENRVWINDGQLKIIKPASASRSSRRTEEKLSLPQAREILLREPKRMMHSTSMEEEAFFRLRNYPAQIADNMHHAMVTMPRKVAFLLHQKPAYISPAIEAFYLRDPIALKPLQKKENRDSMTFAPQDLVTVTVRFPRVGYAQVKSQDFPTPAVFQDSMPSRTDSKEYARAEAGMKVTCGFEMLLTDTHYQDRPAVREMKMLLDDLKTGDEQLPSDADVEAWDQREDDEKWLDIDFDDLQKELGGEKGKKAGFGDKATHENLSRIVKQFEQFLNDDTGGPDGAGLFGDDSDDDLDDDEDDEDDDEDEDKDASFDEDEFSKMMQEMMGMPPDVMKEIMKGQLGPGADAKDPSLRAGLRQPQPPDGPGHVEEAEVSDENDEDMQAFMKQMEAELRNTGALDLEPSSSKKPALKDTKHDTEEDVEELSSDDDIDHEIDVNLAKNLLESLRSQAGMAGPGGNLMGMMGLEMPEDSDDDGQPGPSRAAGSKGKKSKS